MYLKSKHYNLNSQFKIFFVYSQCLFTLNHWRNSPCMMKSIPVEKTYLPSSKAQSCSACLSLRHCFRNAWNSSLAFVTCSWMLLTICLDKCAFFSLYYEDGASFSHSLAAIEFAQASYWLLCLLGPWPTQNGQKPFLHFPSPQGFALNTSLLTSL